MALRDEIQEILDTELGRHPMAQVYLEQGEQGVFDKVMEEDLLSAQLEFFKLQNAITAGLRLALLRLADEIDGMKTDSE